jgi:hypothetical protein
MIMTYKEWLEIREGTKATIYTQSRSKGASVDDSQSDEKPVMLNIDDIVNYEKAAKMQQPASQNNMRAIVDAIKNGQRSYFFQGEERQMTPILVRQVNNLRGVSKPRWDGRTMTSAGGVANSRYKYQVVDGHHRYWAYKAAGEKQIPAIIIAPENLSREKIWTPDQ